MFYVDCCYVFDLGGCVIFCVICLFLRNVIKLLCLLNMVVVWVGLFF